MKIPPAALIAGGLGALGVGFLVIKGKGGDDKQAETPDPAAPGTAGAGTPALGTQAGVGASTITPTAGTTTTPGATGTSSAASPQTMQAGPYTLLADSATPGAIQVYDTATQQPWHQRRRERRAMVPDILTQPAPDLQRVAKAVGGEQAEPRPLALEQRVGGDRRTMDEDFAAAQKAGRLVSEGTRRALDRVDHARRRIGRCGRRLEREHASVRGGNDQVGERAADVDAHAEGCVGHHASQGWVLAVAARQSSSAVPMPSISRSPIGVDSAPEQ